MPRIRCDSESLSSDVRDNFVFHGLDSFGAPFIEHYCGRNTLTNTLVTRHQSDEKKKEDMTEEFRK